MIKWLTVSGCRSKIGSVSNAYDGETGESKHRARDKPLNEGEGGIEPTVSSISLLYNSLLKLYRKELSYGRRTV